MIHMPRFASGNGSRGGRNFGFGRSMAYAGFNAVRDHFGHGHFASVKAHAERWGEFTKWAKSHGVSDARDITVGRIQTYGMYLCDRIRNGDLAVSTAQNTISSINVIMEWMRGDKGVWQSPARLVGYRSAVRETPPLWVDRSRLYELRDTIVSEGRAYSGHLAAMIGLGRDLGLRWKEAALIDARAALKQASNEGRVMLDTGTKKQVPRDVPVRTERQIDALVRAVQIQGQGRSLIPTGLRYASFSQSVSRLWHASDGERFHDLRSAYACERYQELTGQLAPVMNGGRLAVNRDTDRAARLVIAEELGHHRGDVLSHYIGGRAV